MDSKLDHLQGGDEGQSTAAFYEQMSMEFKCTYLTNDRENNPIQMGHL